MPWVGIPAGTGVSSTPMPQLFQERSAAKRSFPGSGNRSDQLQLTGRVPHGRGTNVKPRPEDWTEDGGLEHSAGSARAASGEQSQIRSGSIPSWETFGRANHPSGQPGQQGACPQDFYGGKPRKSQITQLLSTCTAPKIKGSGPPAPKVFNPVHIKFHKSFHPAPATRCAATSARSAG